MCLGRSSTVDASVGTKSLRTTTSISSSTSPQQNVNVVEVEPLPEAQEQLPERDLQGNAISEVIDYNTTPFNNETSEQSKYSSGVSVDTQYLIGIVGFCCVLFFLKVMVTDSNDMMTVIPGHGLIADKL